MVVQVENSLTLFHNIDVFDWQASTWPSSRTASSTTPSTTPPTASWQTPYREPVWKSAHLHPHLALHVLAASHPLTPPLTRPSHWHWRSACPHAFYLASFFSLLLLIMFALLSTESSQSALKSQTLWHPSHLLPQRLADVTLFVSCAQQSEREGCGDGRDRKWLFRESVCVGGGEFSRGGR